MQSKKLGSYKVFRVLLCVGLAFGLALPSYAELRDPEEYFFHDSFGDLQEEVENAHDEGQEYIMIMVELSDCPWCERMKTLILNRSEVQDYFRERFRNLMINVESTNPLTNFDGEEYTEQDFAVDLYRVRASPEFLFFNLDGELATRFLGVLKGSDEFLLLGEFVADEHYKDTDFTSFKRARQSEDSS